MDFEAARKHMVDSQVRPNDVTDLRIQQALETTPREAFLPPGLREQAYVEREIVYAENRSLITARDFGKLLAELEPGPDDLALDVACGAGYSIAVMSMLCEMVVGVEADEKLVEQAEATLAETGVVNAAIVTGDPKSGASRQGPFDVILIANAIETTPDDLLAQLRDGGRLGAIVRNGACSKGVIWRRAGDSFGRQEVFDSSASVVIPGFTRPKAFAF